VLLGIGGEMIVRSSSRLAVALGITPLVIGLTIVSIGTSLPELAVGVIAAWQGSGGLAVGNIAGTNMVNILFILGLSALIRPLPLAMRVLRLDLPVMVIAGGCMVVMAWDGMLGRQDGSVMILAAVLYTALLLKTVRRESRDIQAEFKEVYVGEAATRRRLARTWPYHGAVLVAGMALTILGADLLVDGAVGIARAVGLSEAIIGLTIVAIGTSAPELATTIIGTIRDERDVAVGNLLGSSIYNILVILGFTCVAAPGGLPVERALLTFDIPLMAAVAVLCVPVFLSDRCVSRTEGGMFVAAYLFYMAWLILFRT